MQKLRFINGNGVEIDLTDKVNFGIIDWQGFSADGLNIQSQQVPFQDGGVFLDALMEQRELSVTVAINAKGDLDKRYQLRRQLIYVLNPKLGEGVLIYTDNYLSKQIHVIPQIPLFDTNNSNDSGTPKVSCSFTACNPYWEDLEETVVSFKLGETTIIENKGDISAQMKIELFGNAVNPKIQNITTKKEIAYNNQLQAPLLINTEIGSKGVLEEELFFNIKTCAINFTDCIYVNRYGKFFAIYNRNIISSSDGINWNTVFSCPNTLNAICFSEELDVFVVVGQIHTILTSSDGINWNTIDTTVVGDFQGVCYSEEKHLFVIVGRSTDSLISEDGINWTTYYVNKSMEFKDVCYSDELNMFIAVGAKTNTMGNMAICSDGLQWVEQSCGTDSTLNAIYYSEELNMFVAVGANGIILTSPDGTNWTQQTSNVNSYLWNVIYLYEQKLFFVLGDNGLILTSSDGINWIRRTIDSTALLRSICYSEELGLFIISAINDSIFISTDGMVWNKENNWLTYETLKGVCYSEELNLFVVVGNNGIILTSSNGIDWTKQTFNYSITINSICYSEEKHLFVATSESGLILTSPDAINWSIHALNLGDARIRNVCYSEELNMFVAVGFIITQGGISSLIITSTNGTDWTRQTLTPATEKQLYGVCYSEEKHLFVIVGYYIILTSSDGINWEIIDQTSNHYELYSVCYSEGLNLFVAVGGIQGSGSGLILTSSDGINWEEVNISNEYYFTGVIYSESMNIFIIINNKGTIYQSTDGINWLSVKNEMVLPLNGVVYSEKKNLFVIVGYSGLILNSDFEDGNNKIEYLDINSDISLNLEIGKNKLRLLRDSGTLRAKIKFRQKYIGV